MFRQPFVWQEVEQLRREMDRLFDNTFSLPRAGRQRSTSFPAVNVWTNDDDGIMVTAELPGVNPDDVDISVTADMMTIRGSRQSDMDQNDRTHHRQERTYGEFSRTFQLPYAVDREHVEATVKNGVLTVSLPRAEAEKPKQIPVQTG